MDPFWNVTHNFFALYEATHHLDNYSNELKPDEACYANLIPNLTTLNDNRNFNFSAGGVWHTILHWDLYKEDTKTRIRAVADYTHQLFHQHLTRLTTLLEAHDKFLISKCNSQPIDNGACKKTQSKIQEFYQATQYLLKEVREDLLKETKDRKNPRLTEIFEKHFCKNCFEHMDRLEENYSLIALEGVIEGELPLKSLINASFGLNENPHTLRSFAQGLNSNKLDIRILNTALQGIVTHAQRFHETAAHALANQRSDLAELESCLYNYNYQIFNQIDAEHLEWRKTLNANPKLTSTFYNEETGKMSTYVIVLGKQLGEKNVPKEQAEASATNQLDYNVYFEIHSIFLDTEELDPNAWVVWSSINTAVLGIKLKQAEACLIKPATIHFIDNQGRFALVEKLQPLPNGPLHENTTFYNCIAGWLKWLAFEEKVTPDRLNIDNYMLARHPEQPGSLVLTTLKLTFPSDKFSFAQLEQFVFDIAKGNKIIYKYIMQMSNLTLTEEAVFIKKAAMATFEKTFDHQKETFRKKFKDKSIADTTINLQVALERLRDNCKKILTVKNIPYKIEDLQNKILLAYCEKGCLSFLWPTLEQEIIAQFSN